MTNVKTKPRSAYQTLSKEFDVKPVPSQPQCFTNSQPPWSFGDGIPGAILMAQSAASAYETVPAHYQAHSLQATFFRRAQCHKSVIYGVEVLNDGKTFSSRRVTAEQDGKSVISSVVSFIAKISSPSADTSERSSLSGTIVEHTSVPKMPIEVPKDYHDDLSYTRQDGLQPAVEGCRLPIVLQDSSPSLPISSPPSPHTPPSKISRQYLRSLTPLSHSFNNRANILAIIAFSDLYLGDSPARLHGIPIPGMPPLGGTYDEKDTRTPRIMATITHSISFVDPDAARADEWVYVESESPWGREGRVMATSRMFGVGGRLVATCMQENFTVLQHPQVKL